MSTSPSPLKRLLVQVSHYSLTSLLNLVAGLITFPILTRVFTVADYGVMSLIAATLTVGVALAKLGVQHSILRYHSEISAGKSRFTLPQLISTTLLGMLSTGLVVMLALIVALQIAPARWLADPRLRALFAVAAPLIVVQVVESGILNVLRAEQRTSAWMRYQVAKKYIGLGFILVAVLVISKSLYSFFSARVISEALAVLILSVVLFGDRGQPRPSKEQFSRPLYRELLGFGIPMMIGYEMSGIVLAVGDRYVIDGMLGAAPLGLYSAAYNLCLYVQALAIEPLGQAIMPMYMQMWDRKGADETSAFIGRSLRSYVLLGAPMIAGIVAVGPELLPSLASEKYARAAMIVPWVIAGMVVDGASLMVGAGLYVFRKTRTVSAIVFSCAALNIVLNLILVPRIGILGSAVATLVSYMATAVSMAIAARRLVAVAVPWRTLIRAGLASLVMYVAVSEIHFGQRLLTVAVRVILGALVYVAAAWLIDPDARSLVRGALARFRRPVAKADAA